MRKPLTRPSRTLFFIAIRKQPGKVYGVSVPDCPGCHSWGDTTSHARANALKAVEAWVESGGTPRATSRLSALRSNPDYAGSIWKAVAVDVRLIKRARQRFAEECRRQSLMTRDDPQEREIQDWLERVVDTRDWEA